MVCSLITCFVLLVTLKISCQTQGPIIMSLNNSAWQVRNGVGSIRIEASVPGGIYSDLKRAKILKGNMFYKDNDIKFRWVARENWTYSSRFTVTRDILDKQYVYLTFHGLDTVSSIFLNNMLLGSTNNMFVRFRFDVKSLLKVGENTIEVNFASPVTTALNASSNYYEQYDYIVPPECTAAPQNGECHVNFLRKMQASFSWDWGPAFPSVGIWKPVEIEAFNSVIIRSVSIKTIKSSLYGWELSGSVYMDTAPYKTLFGTILLNVYNHPIQQSIFQQHVKFLNVTITADKYGEASFSFNSIYIHENQVDLWWPNGYGEQNLYNFYIKFITSPEETSKLTLFGFRTVKLVQEPIDSGNLSKGLTFEFEINNMKVFAKGSNYIPSHILPELNDNIATLTHLINSAKYANMNMLRVWGGGIYESELFYKLCDEKGIMIWQDMMFACGMYPTSEDFLQSVSVETIQNVRRLQSHPSIVVWAGNNENEAALRGNWYATQLKFNLYKKDYVKLYVDVIRSLVLQNDNTRDYVISSPSNGLESEREGYISHHPYDPLFGDVHIYQYYSDNWDSYNIQPTRFCSEYGIQSLPSYSTLSKVASKSDLEVGSNFLMLRQHHGSGYSQMEFEIDLNIPRFNHSNLKQYIYYSQVNQGMSMKIMTEKYRSMRDVLLRDGSGLTMGALYWQLNDVWQAPTWSSIEYGGKWKLLHYFAKKFFSEILIYPNVLFSQVTVKVIADRIPSLPPDALLNVMVDCTVYQWNSFKPVKTFATRATVGQLSSATILDGNYVEILGKTTVCGRSNRQIRHNCFMTVKSDNLTVPDNFIFFERLTVVNLPNATINVTIKPMSVKKYDYFLLNSVQVYELYITTDTIALFVWLDIGDLNGYFSDNGFHMTSPEMKIYLYMFEYSSLSELNAVLTVMSVNGKYNGNDL